MCILSICGQAHAFKSLPSHMFLIIPLCGCIGRGWLIRNNVGKDGLLKCGDWRDHSENLFEKGWAGFKEIKLGRCITL